MARKKKATAVESSPITITRSFTRKLNMSVHGGEKFETADLACTVTMEGSTDDQEELSTRLDEFCRDEVQKTINAIDGIAIEDAEEEEAEEGDEFDEEEEAPKKKVLKKKKKAAVEEDEDEDEDEDDDEDEEEAPKKKKKAKKKKMINVGVNVEQEELEEISGLINDLTMAKTPKALKAAAMAIKGESADFSMDQKKYLSAYYKKRKEAIEEAE